MHPLSENIAFLICDILFSANRPLTEHEIRQMLLHNGYCDDDELDAGFSHARSERWIREAHPGPNLTLTSVGITARQTCANSSIKAPA